MVARFRTAAIDSSDDSGDSARVRARGFDSSQSPGYRATRRKITLGSIILQRSAPGGFLSRLRSWFPEREFFMRSQGQVRFVRISSRLQMTVAAIAAGVALAWLVTMAAVLIGQLVSTSNRMALLEREAKVESAESRVAKYRQDQNAIMSDLQKRQDFIEKMVESTLGEMPAGTSPQDTVSDSSSETARTVKKISQVMPEAAGLARIEARQIAFVERLTRMADARSARAEAAIRKVGLNPGVMLASLGSADAQGGPLIPLLTGSGPQIDPRFERLGLSLQRMSALERGLAAIPNTLPASLDYISSGFGYRADPFTGGAAFHAGLDFKGPIGAPIYAAAAGTVTFAGVRQGYGNCVEISHGNGLLTRYAHMSRIGASLGQKVAAGAQIGQIGNTGRSTGPHLHFEVRINDQPVNPRPFLEGSPHVLEEARAGRPAPRG